MDYSEELAHSYLTSVGLSPLIYEPDGNLPPDFLADGRIAVEVRRLNRHETTMDGKATGLETAEYALSRTIRAALHTLGPPTTGQSWFVNLTYRRPLPKMSVVRRNLRRALIDCRTRWRQDVKLEIAPNLAIQLMAASGTYRDEFLQGVCFEDGPGGFLVSELRTNMQICAEEKTIKIARVRARYPEWWLLLVDLVGWGMASSEELNAIQIEHRWDKLILINPQNPLQAFEIKSTLDTNSKLLSK